MKAIDTFQHQIARYLEEKYGVMKLTFILAPNVCDFWAIVRQDQSKRDLAGIVLPAPRHTLKVQLEAFDVRILRPHDTKYLNRLADHHGFFQLTIPAWHDRLHFDEKPSTSEGIAEAMVLALTTPRARIVHKITTETSSEILGAIKIYLNYIAMEIRYCDTSEVRRAQKIAVDMLKHVKTADVVCDDAFIKLADNLDLDLDMVTYAK